MRYPPTTGPVPQATPGHGWLILGCRWVSLILFFLLCSGHLDAQPWSGIIDPSRAIDWSNVGIPGGIPTNRTQCGSTIAAYTGTADAINNALATCSSNQYVLLGSGTFSLSSGITFGHRSNLTLRGAGADQTFIVFTGSGACGGLSADACADSSDLNWCCAGSSPSNTANWTATSYAKGQTQITMDNVSNLSVGAPLILDQCDDGLSGPACTGTPVDTGNIWICGDSSSSNPAYKCSDDLGGTGGASGSQRTGRNQMQIVTVTAIAGNLVTFSPGLYMPNWAAAKNPGAWWATSPVYRDGIENLSMDHSLSNAQAGTIFFNCLACWVSGIRDVNSDRSHVWLLASPRGVVRASYFYGAKNAQSQSYGIEAYSSSDSLFENNIFQHVTSPQVVNGACSGCVISYNYSIDDFETVSPTLLYNSLTLNAAGTDNILAEGNVGASYRADLYHGTHNLNTVFRNEFNGWELGKTDGLLPVFLDPYARYFNVIGNVLGKSGIQTTYEVNPSVGSPPAIYMIGTGTASVALSGDLLSVSSLMRWGNYDTLNSAVRWNASEVPSGLSQYANPVPTSHNLPASFYLSGSPLWWGSMQWPAVGPDVTGYSYGNPAELCYDNSPIDGNYGSNSVLLFNAGNCTVLAFQYAQGPPPNSLAATPISASQINLTWTAPASNGGLANYVLQRCQGAACTNFAQIASPTGTTFSDTGLPPSTSYNYRVQALHTFGSLSLFSNRVSATTQTPPTAPSNLTATASGTSQINLSWTASTGSVGLANYVVQRCQGVGCTNFAQIATPAGVSFSDTGLSYNTSYSYRVQALDTAGNLSPFSNLASATTQTPPTAPSNLTATAIGGQMNLSWTASTSSVGLANYVVQRCQGPGCTNFARIATLTGTTYSDPGLAAGSYSYIVQATDVAGNLSPSSNVATGVIPHLSLSWIASTDSVSAYLVERCQGANCSTFAQIANVAGTAYNDTSVIGNTNYIYRARATDAAGNLSVYSNLATATTLPFIGYVQGNYATPQTPQTTVNVTFTAAQVAGDLNVVVVGWKDSTAIVNAVTDGSGNAYTLAVGPTVQMGIASQSIYYAKNITPAAAGANTVTVTFSSAAVYPDIRILEYNGADPNNPVDGAAANIGNSATSSSGSLTTTNASDLIFGANLVQTFTTGPGSGFTTELLTSPAGDIAEDQMVSATGSYIATASVSPSGQWIMQMVAFRAASGSTTPPTAPSNLTATAASTSQINLSWTASTSTVGLKNYIVQRCQGAGCTTFAQIAAPTGTTYSDTGLTAGTSYSYQVQAVDTAGNLSVFSNVASATTPGPPTAPGNLTATATSVTQINLSWIASTSTVGLQNYIVQRCQGAGCTTFAQIAAPTGTTYSDTGLTSGTSYSYQVQAVDTAGNLSAFSNVASATTQAPPTAPGNLTATVVSTSQINLSWTASTSGVGLANYVMQRCQGAGCTNFAQIATATGTTYSDSGLATGTYSYRVRAADSAGNLSPYSNVANGVIPDTQPPTAPSNLTATTSGYQISLSWAGSTDDVGVTGYLLERCQGVGCSAFAQIATSTGTIYNDTSLVGNTTYGYRVRATDAAGNLSLYSNVANATTPPFIRYVQGSYATPQTPQTTVNVTFTAAQVAGDLNVVVVGWKDSTAIVNAVTDGSGNAYALAVGPTVQTGIASQSIYYAKNIAAAAAGANTVTVTFSSAAVYPDIRILEYNGADPNNPVDGTAANIGNSATSSSGSLTTTNASDLIFGANLVQTFTTGPGSGFTTELLTSPAGDIAEDQMVSATGSYIATASVSPSGQWIMQMVAFRAASGSTTPPTAPSNLTATAASTSQINLSWTASTSTVGLRNYIVQRCQGAGCTTFAPIASPVGTSYSDTGLTSGSSYSYQVQAIDTAGNLSVFSNVASATTPGPPTAPGNLTATSTSVTQINLSWTASTSTVGVTNYIVQRCAGARCTTFAQIAAPTGTTYSDTGLTSGTSYSYQVQAIDTAGNLSAFSNVASTTTQAPPTAPSNLTATAASTSQINLSWTASTSTVGLKNYILQRCQGAGCTNFAQIAAPTGTTYSDTGLTSGTSYSYQVQAVDTAGNLSVFSNIASATTQAPPTAPSNLTATVVSTSQINLSWTASTSSVGLANYVVQRCQGAGCTNFAQIATATGTTYSDSGLATGTYSYRVRAADTAGNLSPYSNVASGVIPDTQPPTAPSNLTATTTGYQIGLSWTASTDDVGVTAYLLERCQGTGCSTFAQIAGLTSTVYNDTSVIGNTSYTYRVRATDAAGNLSAYSNLTTATTLPFIKYVQGTYATPQTPQTTVGVTFPAAQVAGDLNVVVVGWKDSTAIANAVTDGSGNAYTLGVGPTVQTGIASQSVYYAKNITAAAAAANTVTVTFSSAAVYPDIRILEYSGADPNNPVDTTAANTGNSATSSSGFVTTTNATDLIFGANLVQTSTSGPGSGFTIELLTSPAGDIAEDQMVTASGSYGASAPLVVAGPWIMQMVAFRALAGVGTTPPTAPSNLTATAASTSQINLSWTASTSTVGLKNYIVQRCQGAGCSTFVQIASPAGTTYSDTGLTSGTSYSYQVQAVDTAGNLSMFSNVASATTQGPPTAPSNLTATAASTSQINLSWTASTSTVGLKNYIVQRCQGAGCTTFAPIASPVGTTYSDTGLTSGTSYTYQVQAIDTAGNMSAFSSVASATTQAPPTTPSNLTATATSVTQINLSWTASTSTVGVTNYIVQRCQGAGCTTFAQIAAPAGTTYSDTGLTSGTSYSYQVRAVDTAGNLSVFSNVASATTLAPPTAPSNLTATATTVTQINLSWTASTSTVGLKNYIVQRCQGAGCISFAQIAAPTGTTYSDTGLTSGTSYSYQVQAIDTAGNLSVFSNVASTTTQAPPTAPGNLTATAASTSQINLSWTASTSTVGLKNYIVQRCQGVGCTTFVQIASPAGSTYSDTGLTSGTSYSYQVQAIDTAGNLSVFSNVASATTQAPPTAPGNLTATAGLGQINLSWAGSTSTVGLKNYILQRCQGVGCTNFAQIAAPAGTTFNDTGLSFNTTYSYQVQAIDTAGNLSAFSNVAGATTQAPPTTPSNLTATAASTSQINLSWNASTSTVGLKNYIVQRCQGAGCTTFAQIASPAGTAYSDTGLISGTSYSYQVQAVDTAGNLSVFSNVASATTQAPPTAPGNLTATAGLGQINLSWTASTSTVGLTNYIVQRCQGAGCTNFAQIAAPVGTTFSDTGLSFNTSYSYQVQAVDTAGNLSPYSNVASATTLIIFFSSLSVQSNEAAPQTPQTTVKVTLNAAHVAGDLVVGWNDRMAVVEAVTDGRDNAYTLASLPLDHGTTAPLRVTC